MNRHASHQKPPVVDTAIDPVCGMAVPVRDGARHADHAGQTYYFCSEGCRSKFAADPSRYVKTQSTPAQSNATPGTQWTCPMHPEIVRDAPGSCPICGMALEPLMPSRSPVPNPELADMTRRFWIGLAL